MSVKVKICGVRTPAIIDVAAEAGADYVGLVFFPRSPRFLKPEAARTLAAAAKGRIETVAVLVDPDDALIDFVVERVRPDLIQLHGGETPKRVAAIRARTGLPLLKAIAVAGAGDTAKASAYRGIADLILFDAKPDPAALLPGGNGVPFDWTLLSGAGVERPFALSGGLTPANVGEALSVTHASLVDVSSAVEGAPGEKDANLVREFIRAAKSTDTQVRAKAS
ncbi:MAG: phosphoribosylanthranilate isomerase [Methyloceanibacter sp.]